MKNQLVKQSFWTDSIYVFAILIVFFLPFPLELFPIHQSLVNFLFQDLLTFIAQNILGFTLLKNAEISSDSLLLYVLILFLWLLAFIISIFLQFWTKWQTHRTKVLYLFQQILAYYLAFQMLNYGIDKVFKAQFYLPEPNILYTDFGRLDKDILFWSVMGVSYEYNLFMGITELLAALLIFYRKTRVLGFFLALGVMLNIIAINFSFDISVKVYSSFLCFLSLLLISPYFQKLYYFFILQKEASLKNANLSTSFIQSKALKVGLKSFVIGLILIEIFVPFLRMQNFNDDLAPRPYLHGAYEVREVWQNKEKIPLNESPVKRVFVHRRNFLIFQNSKEDMIDYELSINQEKQILILRDYQKKIYNLKYKFDSKRKILWLEYSANNQNYQLKTKTLDWEKLPALQRQFHWAMDYF